MIPPLQFGIKELDDLIAPAADSAKNRAGHIPWTAAIVGPDGCGKSILALHVAAEYHQYVTTYRDKHNLPVRTPRVLYVSTDLSYNQALIQWYNFGLDRPVHRADVLAAAYNNEDRKRNGSPTGQCPEKIDLAKDPDKSIRKLLGDAGNDVVHFLDFQSETAGDDWGFINHLIGLLSHPSTADDNDTTPRHLLIVDAIEGLETLSGHQDAFGLPRDRRSRVAQLIRNAALAKAHVLLVVEDPKGDIRLPEQFVTDLVIRLRQEMDGNYNQRTLEIEKCRAIAHARGRHELTLRDGKGSFTGNRPHLDDPRIPWKKKCEDCTRKGETCPDPTGKHAKPLGPADIERFGLPAYVWKDEDEKCVLFLSHVRVIPSLHRWNRVVREQQSPIPKLQGCPHFGLPVLDPLVSPKPNETPTEMGALLLLLGDPSTHKGSLTRAFLAGAFREEDMSCQKKDHYQNVKSKHGIAVLLTTRFLDQNILQERIAEHLLDSGMRKADIQKAINERVLCQRLSIRHTSTGRFIETIEQYIRCAQMEVSKTTTKKDGTSYSMNDIRRMKPQERREFSSNIRIAIEDWNDIIGMYPTLRNDALLLQSVITLLKREGVLAIIVSTQQGPPGMSPAQRTHELRHLNETQILTWPVAFFGEKKVAITVHARQTSSQTPVICALTAADERGERLVCTRDFDLYSDVDLGQPQRIPLKVRLYVGSVEVDHKTADWQWLRILRNTFSETFHGPQGQKVLRLESHARYDALFTSIGVSGTPNRDYTLIVQIDEFWSLPKACIALLGDYWEEEVCQINCEERTNAAGRGTGTYAVASAGPLLEADINSNFLPHAEWQGESEITTPRITSRRKLTKADDGVRLKRQEFFIQPSDGGPQVAKVDRVPYLWDFGMILADRVLWDRYKGLPVGANTIGSIWNKLCCLNNEKKNRRLHLSDVGGEYKCSEEHSETVSWDEFLTACQLIAERESIIGFDVDELCTEESLSCFLLELWASLDCRADMWAQIATRGTEPCSLFDLVVSHRLELFKALATLVHYCPHFSAENRRLSRRPASAHSAASRHWYSTACAKINQHPDKRYVLLRLPGNFSGRGDWSLAIAGGSRSGKLGRLALDLLCSRRQNLLRLQEGIGLPVRDILPDSTIGKLTTAIVCHDERAHVCRINYGDICDLGQMGSRRGDFRWLWRSQIRYYDVECVVWRRWIAWMIESQERWFGASLRKDTSEVFINSSEYRYRVKTFEEADGEKREELKKAGGFYKTFDAFQTQLRIVQAALRSVKEAT